MAVLLATTLACGTTGAMRDAQEWFNRAATADLHLRTANDAETIALIAARDGGYVTTIGIVDGVSGRDRNKLVANKLWGNALMLKAISQWRLGNYDAARKTAKDALDNYRGQLGTRDTALLSSLDGLISIDEAHAKLEAAPGTPCTFATVDSLVAYGLEALGTQRKLLDPGHPVQGYLLLSQLAAHKNRLDASTACSGGAITNEHRQARRDHYCELDTRLSEGGTTEEETAQLEHWHGLLGIPSAECP